MTSGQPAQGSPSPNAPRSDGSVLARLISRRVGGMLVRNTIVSCSVFAVGLLVLWILVKFAGVNKIFAAGVGFVIANSLHYILGRSWIFKGTDRDLRTGYILFLVNSGVGLLLTTGLYGLLLKWSDVNYLVARIIVSLFAGLMVFILNAVFNFRQV
ncbi:MULTISPECIES: GtrA family protein [Sphingomonadaceae]|jgi:putative flippase GtrA|uniref:GtrA family protein n=1 Tax=Sphingomonadales TaxID=204457 RepID=UPI0009DE5A28|nr:MULTISPECIES: GtrA family protein [Sphingomonadaceae]